MVKIIPALAAKRWITVLAVALLAGFGFGCSKSAKGPDKRPEATLEELNGALGVWAMTKGGVPQNLSELTNFPSLRDKRLPTLPPGKKLILDKNKRQVIIADE
jgi:hypothetical protein